MADYDEYWRRRKEHERLTSDVGEIRRIAEDHELEWRGQISGPFEVEVITDAMSHGAESLAVAQAESTSALAEALSDGLADLSDETCDLISMVGMATVNRMDEQTRHTKSLINEVKEVRFVLEDIEDLGRYNLVAAGAQLAVSYAQLSRLEDIEDVLGNFSEHFGEIEDTLEYHGELLESIDAGVWGLHDRMEDLEGTVIEVGERITDAVVETGRETIRSQVRVGKAVAEIVVGVGDKIVRNNARASEAVARTVVETGREIVRSQVRVGEVVIQEIRLSAQQSARLLGRHITHTSQAQTKEITSFLAILDQRAHKRHEELIRAVISPVSNSANEKYAQARTLYANGELGRSLRKLSHEVFAQDNTHELGWILYGEISQRRGRPREARAAFRRASDYALIHEHTETYELACLHLARLELTVGNTRQAKHVLITAHREIIRLSGRRSAHLAYELFKIDYAQGQRRWKKVSDQWEQRQQARQWRCEQEAKLRRILLLAPDLHDDVAHNPLLESITFCNPLSWGQAPFIQLFDLLKHYGEIFTMDRSMKNDRSIQSSVEILRKVLYLTQAGRVQHASRRDDRQEIHPSAKDVFDILTKIQTRALSIAKQLDADHPVSEGNVDVISSTLFNVPDEHFYDYLDAYARAFETLLLYYVDHVNDPRYEGEELDLREHVDPESVLIEHWDVWKKGYSTSLMPTVAVRIIEEKLSRCFNSDTKHAGYTTPEGEIVPPVTIHAQADPEAVAWMKKVWKHYRAGRLAWITEKRPDLKSLLKSLMRQAHTLR